MHGNFDQWMSFLEDDVEVVRTLGTTVDRKIIYCRSIETSCQLYEYYNKLLEESAYCGTLHKVLGIQDISKTAITQLQYYSTPVLIQQLEQCTIPHYTKESAPCAIH